MVSKVSRVKSSAGVKTVFGPKLRILLGAGEDVEQTSEMNTDRSHFRTSCDAMSYMSSNISRMAAVPNAGMRMRSGESGVRCDIPVCCDHRDSRANSQFSSPGFA